MMKPILVSILLPLIAASTRADEPHKHLVLFNGKDFTGWEGETKKVWRVEGGALTAGSLERALPHNEYLASTREFENFDLRLKYQVTTTDTEHQGCLNGGVQFRSKRVPNSHEVVGYQADLGDGWDGWLYDEGRRGRHIAKPTPEVQARAFKKEGWNEYRVRAEGRHIQLWLNGVRTVNYTEEDLSIPQKGIIALQIHDVGKLIVRYKDITIEELPSTKFGGPLERFADPLPALPRVPFAGGKFALRPGEVVVFAGPANVVFEQQQGWLETLLTAGAGDQRPTFRPMGWEGDTVYEQWRAMNFGGWGEQFAAVGASVIFTWFGQVETLDDTHDDSAFAAA
jgi:hypothetical protein